MVNVGSVSDVAAPFWIVNIGARITGNAYDNDYAWQIAFNRSDARSVAYEGNTTYYQRLTDFVDRRDDLRTRVSLVNEFVTSSTIGPSLARNGVPPKFALLKMDIDSIDLPVVRAILRAGMRPDFLLAEYNQYTPPPIEFTALEPRRGEPITPKYGGLYRGANRQWPCHGASLSAWARFAAEYGYLILQLDTAPANANVLLISAELHQRHYAHSSPSSTTNASSWSTDFRCHLSTFRFWGTTRLIPYAEYITLHKDEKRSRASQLPAHEMADGKWDYLPPGAFNFAPATAAIDEQCHASQTPYAVRIDGRCCPHNASGSLMCRAACGRHFDRVAMPRAGGSAASASDEHDESMSIEQAAAHRERLCRYWRRRGKTHIYQC